MELAGGMRSRICYPKIRMSIRAVFVDPSAPEALRLTEAPEPRAGSSQVLIDVHHVSLSYGDLNDARSGRVPPGAVLGSDAAAPTSRRSQSSSKPPNHGAMIGWAIHRESTLADWMREQVEAVLAPHQTAS